MRPLPDGIRRVRLATDEGGRQWFVLLKVGGGEQRLSPDEFAARMQHDHESRSLFYRFLNITSPVGLAWVGLGLLGQILFTGRMVLQWVVSERAERSVVPVQFWWMSLAGATMLMIYFVWRRDVIGVLGQSTGWIIYARNLRLIYRSQRS